MYEAARKRNTQEMIVVYVTARHSMMRVARNKLSREPLFTIPILQTNRFVIRTEGAVLNFFFLLVCGELSRHLPDGINEVIPLLCFDGKIVHV